MGEPLEYHLYLVNPTIKDIRLQRKNLICLNLGLIFMASDIRSRATCYIHLDADRPHGVLSFSKPKTNCQLLGFLGLVCYCQN